MQNSNSAQNQLPLKKSHRSCIGLLIATLLLPSTLFFAACAEKKSTEDTGEWASGNPDDASGSGSATLPPVASATPEPAPAPSNPPASAVYFAVSKETVQLAHGPALTWDGCSASALVKGGYDGGTQCGKGYLYPKFAEHLNKHFFRCVEEASFRAGYRAPQRLFLRHLGTYEDRNVAGSTSLSLHAYARAIDLAGLNMYDEVNALTDFTANIRNYSGTNATFYDDFRQCWKDSMPDACVPGQREYSGSIGTPGSALGGNTDHNDHIHLSFPFCAG